MITLYSSLFRLAPLRDTTLPVNQGRQIHAAFLDLIRQSDPELSEALHDVNERKPFSVSMLEGGRNDGRTIWLREGEPCWLRFTLMGRRMFGALNQGLLAARQPRLRIQQTELALAEVLTTNGAHPWSGSTTAEVLVTQAGADREITLQFHTPTSFEWQRREKKSRQLELSPVFVFGNLADKWMKMGCDEALNLADWANKLALMGVVASTRPDGKQANATDALREVFDAYIGVSRMHDVNTHELRYHGEPFIGTTGTFTYEIFGQSELAQEVAHVVNVLANAALYFGVGSKTTHGMGQTRRLKN